MSDQIEKFVKLKEQVDSMSQDKIRVEERLRNERQNLEKIVKEIEAKGLDPKNLSEIKSKLEKELVADLEALEKGINEASEKLKALEGQLG
jgi:predicted  nucleic acid-binding Zn-ribbon protein